MNQPDPSRVLHKGYQSKMMTAQQAAQLVKDGMTVATSGFSPAGHPKAVPTALAQRVKESGETLGITLIAGASVGPELDTLLCEAGVIRRRYAYQTDTLLRNAINGGEVAFSDLHLSQLPLYMKYGYFGKIDLAIVEAVAIDEEGHIFLSTSGGISNVAVATAEKVIIEVNSAQPLSLMGLHDNYEVALPPHTQPIPLTQPQQRIGKPYLTCPPEKIAGIVLTHLPDQTNPIAPIDENARLMAKNLIGFLEQEVAAGRLPENLLPLQSGIGNVANAVLAGLLHARFKNLRIYTEVLQDSALDLIDAGLVLSASTTAITLSPQRLPLFYENIDRYKDKIIIRPQEISNSPEIIRRLGVIAMNTAIEADIYGNVNSTHIGGTRLMNGIGGSSDFTSNGYLSIFTTASTAKGGSVSSVVPAVSHMDHNEHGVMVLVTEQGVADLRGLAPVERARRIIENCAHPRFRPELQDYLGQACAGCSHHIPLPG